LHITTWLQLRKTLLADKALKAGYFHRPIKDAIGQSGEMSKATASDSRPLEQRMAQGSLDADRLKLRQQAMQQPVDASSVGLMHEGSARIEPVIDPMG